MRNLCLFIGLLAAFVLSGCTTPPGPNSARMVELDQAGQIMPGVPAIEGGCIIEAGENYKIDELRFEGGNCTVKMSVGE